MKAIYIDAPRHVSIRDIPTPDRKKGEVLLKPLYGGICGSDLSSYRGVFAYFDYPRIPGHEFSAQIIDADDDLPNGLKPGMIVTCNPYFNCGQCYACRHGVVNACEHNETMGCQRDGAFCEYITMPAERVYDGKGLDAKTLALVEPFCIGYHSIQRAGVKKGDRILIIGAGTIGILTLIAAKLKGADVYIADILPAKLERAKTFGATGTLLNDSQEHFNDQVRELAGESGFDITIEAVGQPSTFQNCIDSVCFGGKVILLGVSKRTLDFNFTIIQKKELNIFGSRNALQADFLEVIDIVQRQNIPLDQVATHLYPFERAADAFSDFDKNTGDMLKVLIDFA